MTMQKSVLEISSFKELSATIQQLEPKLSFFGWRYVAEHNEVLAIDAVAAHMIKLLEQNPHFTENDRPYVKAISEHINRIYKISDNQVKNSNFFTRISVWLRNVISEIFGSCRARWWWKDCEVINQIPYCQVFEYYTAHQFQEKFKCTPEQAKKRCPLTKYEGEDSIIRWKAPILV
ncbi:MAG: hypothetical protein KR126chlam3_01311 [Chlamydiae bacterium]|nr:hypothetical protein [Chlamydiota bacterium]